MTVMDVATRVRRILERHNRDHRFWQDDLAGACGTAALLLHRALRHWGYRSRVVVGYYGIPGPVALRRDDVGHCWVTLGRRILDITATQYGLQDPVYIPRGFMATRYHPILVGAHARAFLHDDWADAAIDAQKVLRRSRALRILVGLE